MFKFANAKWMKHKHLYSYMHFSTKSSLYNTICALSIQAQNKFDVIIIIVKLAIPNKYGLPSHADSRRCVLWLHYCVTLLTAVYSCCIDTQHHKGKRKQILHDCKMNLDRILNTERWVILIGSWALCKSPGAPRMFTVKNSKHLYTPA